MKTDSEILASIPSKIAMPVLPGRWEKCYDFGYAVTPTTEHDARGTNHHADSSRRITSENNFYGKLAEFAVYDLLLQLKWKPSREPDLEILDKEGKDWSPDLLCERRGREVKLLIKSCTFESAAHTGISGLFTNYKDGSGKRDEEVYGPGSYTPEDGKQVILCLCSREVVWVCSMTPLFYLTQNDYELFEEPVKSGLRKYKDAVYLESMLKKFASPQYAGYENLQWGYRGELEPELKNKIQF